MGDGGTSTGLFDVQRMPVSLTCGLYGEALIADPTAEEEALMAATVSAAVDGSGRLIGRFTPPHLMPLLCARELSCMRALTQGS